MQELDPLPRPIDHLTACGTPDAPALIVGGEALTFAELERRVEEMAGWLRGRGIAPGDRVASWLPKTLAACLLPLAAPRIGAVHVPINPVLKRAQAAYILADSGACLLVTQEARAATFEAGDLPEGCGIALENEIRSSRALRLPAKAGAQGLGTSELAGLSDQDPSSLAALLYTSGSTGRPKGVMLSHANLWLGAISVAHYLKLAADDRTLCVLPFAFDYGQNQLLSTWAAGACAVPLDYLTARDVVKAVERHQITTLAGVPPLWVQLTEASWPETTTLRRLTNSGGALTEPLVRRLRAMFSAADLYAMYGLTEAFRSTYLDPALIDAHPTAIGAAIPFAEVLVVRPDGSIAADGEAGELVHCGTLVAQGYWHAPQRTAERFRPAPAASRYGGTSVWSGDTVVRGADGLLRFVGRADEMIKSAGNRISPTEIEEAVVATGLTGEAVALGVPDVRLGQAILVIARGDGSAEETLRMALKRDLPNFMQPARFVWLAELPRGPNGKLDRARLKADFAT
ncbi:acyl-CoA ligase (AMP-forming), exosortase A system-associated [Sphingomonas sp.]|uniref:acyl-CoA ligase (AMP-forming), exosortase A system-associated n=1 Tax=Sphingomonas sp. TaxID=28214 RepID=UPI002DBD3A69|nr:acyl-CoA ligase (AMP-forming), exosortase A system-associated [Sphingomonas sp.]HEU4969987.1 acyl-CoA ligase (AMP-forming), exosortase A system-associated [Sphingomonas sp.]